jgi:hypothetical protein
VPVRVVRVVHGQVDLLLRVVHELTVVDAHAPLVARVQPRVVRASRSIGVAPAVAVHVDLVLLAAVVVDVVAGTARGLWARVGAVGHAVVVGVLRVDDVEAGDRRDAEQQGERRGTQGSSSLPTTALTRRCNDASKHQEK